MRVLTVRSKKLFFTVCVVVYCLKTVGLAPFSVPIGKPAQINPYDYSVQAFFISKAGLAYNILLLIPVIIVPSFHPPNFLRNSWNGLSIGNILSALSTMENIVFIVTSCLIILSWAFGQKSAACILNGMLEVDVSFSGLKKRPFNKRALISSALHIILNTFMWISQAVFITTYIEIDNLLLECFSRLPGFIIHWFMIEYIIAVGLVARDLETVNKYLLDFKQFGGYLSPPPIRNRVLVVSVTNHSNSQVASLKVLRSVRTRVNEICRDIADFFSFPILCCIASCFIPIFKHLYQIFQTTNGSLPAESAWATLILILRYIYPIVSLTLNVTRIKREAGLTGQIVHKLLAAARTEEIKAEMEQFSLQLLHEKVDFTACGFFTLDSTLLQSMLAGVASYAVILMQFRSPVCNCNCNCNWNDTSAE